MNRNRIHLSLAQMSGKEQHFIQEAFTSNWIAPLGPLVDGFEADLSAYLGGEVHTAALSSGTAALHLSLLLLGVQAGDEVLCQSFTFAASANPITYLGATPVFIDSEEDSWNLCPQALEQAIEARLALGKKPKALIAVHLYGMPAAMDRIEALATRYQIPLIEDAAEALGSRYQGQACGRFGQFSILSFNGNKIITTSGGGALVSASQEAIAKARFLATQARDAAPYYQHSQIGYNYRLSNVLAGIGRGQMTALPQFVERRRAINQRYRQELAQVPGLRFQTEPDARYRSNYWLTTLLIDPAVHPLSPFELMQRLEADNIECRHLWKPLHLQPVFAHCPFYGSGSSQKLFEQGLCLPSGAGLSDEDIRYVSQRVTFHLTH